MPCLLTIRTALNKKQRPTSGALQRWPKVTSATAQTAFAQAQKLEGYEYALYALGYAQAAVRTGRAEAALEIIDAAVPPDPISPRFDLEKDRVRALLLSAEAELALGRHIEAASRAEDFLARFNAASPDHSAVVRAQTLVNR